MRVVTSDEVRIHSVVGYKFQVGTAEYICIRWGRNAGYDMLLVSEKDDFTGPKRFDIANVSERAIRSTYHYAKDGYRRYPHHEGCNCWVCEGREDPS